MEKSQQKQQQPKDSAKHYSMLENNINHILKFYLTT